MNGVIENIRNGGSVGDFNQISHELRCKDNLLF